MAARRRQPQTIEELLAPDRVWVTPCGCWLWLGGDDGAEPWPGLGNYGRILRPGTRRVEPVHRWAFRTFKGPIPFGYDVDHMCAKWAPEPRVVRKCVNPDHLQAIPPRLNQQLKLFRRKGFGCFDMDFDTPDEPPIARPPAPELPPILAPGETLDDLQVHP